jgi:hypothetical protein
MPSSATPISSSIVERDADLLQHPVDLRGAVTALPGRRLRDAQLAQVLPRLHLRHAAHRPGELSLDPGEERVHLGLVVPAPADQRAGEADVADVLARQVVLSQQGRLDAVEESVHLGLLVAAAAAGRAVERDVADVPRGELLVGNGLGAR